MGRVIAPYGVKGWIRIQPFTAAAKNLLAYREWWIDCGDGRRCYRVTQSRLHGAAVLAKLEGCDDRDAASRFRNRELAVPRTALPEPAANEYYWADLIGLSVVNREGRDFGRVSRILPTGANEVLVVQGERERLIPFIAEVILAVDLVQGVIRVDWGADY